MNYWLMKCEPSAYSIDDLEREGKTFWNGVRNYQARNFLRDSLKKGDLAFFYHSNAEPSGVVGLMEIVKEGYPDHSAFEPKNKYYDAASTPEKPVWYMVDVAFREKFSSILSLADLKANPKLKGLMVLQKGSRLSIQPVSAEHFREILKTARKN